MNIIDEIKSKIKNKNVKIVFPEAENKKILKVASRLYNDQLALPILLGNKIKIKIVSEENDINVNNINIIDPLTFNKLNYFIDLLVKVRKNKITLDQARKKILDNNYFGTMLVYSGMADCMVSGIIHTTGDTVRPALQIIKTKKNISRVSGAMLMCRKNERYIFADCAININPSAKELAEIAIESAKTAKIFNIFPKVAMLSFSTKGSAKCDEVLKMQEATRLAHLMEPNLLLDGELQFDAAYVPSVADKKAPNSLIKGEANVYIFPELQSGNIGYKIAQRLGHFDAIGPILQGLNKPISDLSRGASENDIYNTSIITIAQSIFAN